MSSELRVDKIVPVDGVAANSGNISYGGGIVQVVYNQINSSLGQYSSNSTSYNDTGHDVLITPKFATSKILVSVGVQIYSTNSSYHAYVGIVKNDSGDFSGSDILQVFYIIHLVFGKIVDLDRQVMYLFNI